MKVVRPPSESAGDNGNVVGITNNRDTTRTQSFTYDQVNRIVTAQTSSTHRHELLGRSVHDGPVGQHDRYRRGLGL